MANYRAGLAAAAVYNVNRGKGVKMIGPMALFGESEDGGSSSGGSPAADKLAEMQRWANAAAPKRRQKRKHNGDAPSHNTPKQGNRVDGAEGDRGQHQQSPEGTRGT
jgi:hypothetical protein